MSLVVRSKKSLPADPSALFWTKVEKFFGEIPKLIQLILDLNGFDSFLALKGIQWDDKQQFFEILEESVKSLTQLDDGDEIKIKIKNELAANRQSLPTFKLKLGHKNLIINLCNELQNTNYENFNATYHPPTVTKNSGHSTQLVVRKSLDGGEEHGYSREDDIEQVKKRQKLDSVSSTHHHFGMSNQSEENDEQVQYVHYDPEDDEIQYLDSTEYAEDGAEIVEYQEVNEEGMSEQELNESHIYCAEQIIKNEAEAQRNFTISHVTVGKKGKQQQKSPKISNLSSSSSSSKKSKKPQHMYNEEFLQSHNTLGRIGTPGRRRPKISKTYPDTDQGMLERWSDLVRQSCEVIVPHEVLAAFELSHIDICKIGSNIWEVHCPLCTKKLRLQLTHEGKYINFKRSNFERHLRIVHCKNKNEEPLYLEEIQSDEM